MAQNKYELNYRLVPELNSWHNPQCRLRFIILNGISAGWWRGTTHFLIPITTTPGTGHYRLGWSQLNQKNGDKIDRSTACCLLLHTLIVICKLCSKLVLQPAYSREKILSQMWHGDADEKDNRQLNESKAYAFLFFCGRSFYFRVVKKCYQMFSRVFQCSARVFNF